MRKSWWKILGVALIIYSFTMGLLIPLGPGISKFEPSQINTGQQTIQITGYNTFYTKSEEPAKVWLKYDSAHTIAANQVIVQDDRKLEAQFDVPKYHPNGDTSMVTSLIVYDDYNGASVLQKVIILKQDTTETNAALGSKLWSGTRIEAYGKDEVSYPFKKIIYETIRNLFFHVPFWFAMFILFIAGITQSIQYLRTGDHEYDYKSMAFTLIGTLFGVIGLCTGMIWAKDTWGTYWTWQEVKMNMTAIALLIYLAYFILRQSFDDDERRARISAVYVIFAFAAMIALLYVVPRMVSSLHPGAEGNPAFSDYDLDSTMRLVFYPTIIGWTLLGVWLASIVYRMQVLRDKLYDM